MPERPIYTFLFDMGDDFDNMSREEQGRTIIHHLQLAAKARQLDLRTVVAEYTGSGDSWEDATWMFYGADAQTDIQIEFAESVIHQLNYWIGDWISSQFPGWENNDGGFGVVTFELVNPRISLNHNQRFTDSRAEPEMLCWPDDDPVEVKDA